MRRRLLIALATIVAATSAAVAVAFWSGTGDGQASTTLADMSAPTASAPASRTGSSVPVSWSAAKLVPDQPARASDFTYTVAVSTDGGSVFVPAGGTCAGTLDASTLSCRDDTAGSSRSYRVTGHLGGWSATSNTVTTAVTALDQPTITGKPATTSANGSPGFSFTGNGDGFECAVDSGSLASCSSGQSYTLSDGAHTFHVRATSGPDKGPERTYSWTIDTSAPTISDKPADPSGPSVSFSFSDVSYSSIQCKIETDSGFGGCSSPKTYSGLASGSHTFQVRALDADGVATATSSYTWSVQAPPVNNGAPAITGTVAQGQTLTATNGTWSNNPTSYAYQWQRCSVAAACVDIASATNNSYALTAADSDYGIQVKVTASNVGGSGSAISASTAPVPRSTTPTVITNGDIDAAARLPDGSTIIGGGFSSIGPPRSSGAVSTSDANAISQAVHANGTIFVATGDGAGGWYIGGDFTFVNALPRAHLAHIDSSGAVDSWNPGVGGSSVSISALALSGSTLDVAGVFTTLGGQSRKNLGAVSTVTGLATTWNPAPALPVGALAISGGILYVGGNFTSISGQARTRLAAYDSSSALLPWAPKVGNGGVLSIVPTATAIYVGGTFTTFSESPSKSRAGLAAIDPGTGLLTTWNPAGSGSNVDGMALSGTTLYVGGSFSTMSGVSRTNLAAFDTGTGSVTSWNPGTNNSVVSVAVADGDIYASGPFTTLGGESRPGVGAVDPSGNVTSWNPPATSTATTPIWCVAPASGKVFLAGTLKMLGGGSPRNHLAKLDRNGSLTSWAPGTDDTVSYLGVIGDTVYAGGFFFSATGADGAGGSRNQLAAFDVNSGALSGWSPDPNNTIFGLAAAGGVVYVGGAFTTVNGITRNHVAALDPATGAPTAWNPGANGDVYAFAFSGNTAYLGGHFTGLGGGTGTGAARTNVGAVSTADSAGVVPWTTTTYPNNTVLSLAVAGGKLYAGGQFTKVGTTTSRSRAAAMSTTDGSLLSWNPNPGNVSAVNAILLSGNVAYLAGDFTTVGGATHNAFAAVDATSGAVASWDETPYASNDTGMTLAGGPGDSLFLGAGTVGLLVP